jgi:hypothetical protein
MRTGFLASALLLVVACGARSSLLTDSPREAGVPVADAGPVGPVDDAGNDGPEIGPTCNLGDMTTWRKERYRDTGDYERAAVDVSGEPWVALKVQGGNVVLARLGVDASQGIVFRDRIEIPSSPVYPAALDVDSTRFVLLTSSGINGDGDIELWRVDRNGGSTLRVPVGNPPTDPGYTADSAVGLVGSNIVVAYARLGGIQGTIELRDDRLNVIQSLAVGHDSFTAVRTSSGAVDVYEAASNPVPAERVHAENGMLLQQAVDPSWSVIGGLGGFLVETGTEIRMTQGTAAWSGAWPHSQISPPAVVRTAADKVAFSLETELTAVVGYPTDAGLAWQPIEVAPGAPGTGAALLPVIEQGRLGLFYLGLEIPSPQQPLRYFGLECQ